MKKSKGGVKEMQSTREQIVEAMKKLNENAKVQVLTEKGEVVLTVDGKDANFALFVVHEGDESNRISTVALQFMAARYLPSLTYTISSSILDQVKEAARRGDLMKPFALSSEYEFDIKDQRSL
jgi:hypothetical protein